MSKRKRKKNIFGESERPRLCVNKSIRHFNAQIIDDDLGVTLIGLSTKGFGDLSGNKDGAIELGKLIAVKALEKGIVKVKFDRRTYIYHGRIKAFADSAREHGLVF